jgi:hypothetical protein
MLLVTNGRRSLAVRLTEVCTCNDHCISTGAMCAKGPFRDMIERIVLDMISFAVKIVLGPNLVAGPVDVLFKEGITHDFMERVTGYGVPYDAFDVGLQHIDSTGKPYWKGSDKQGRAHSHFLCRHMNENARGQGLTCVCVAIPSGLFKGLLHKRDRMTHGMEAMCGGLIREILKTQTVSTGKVTLLHEVPGSMNERGEDYATPFLHDPGSVTLDDLTAQAVDMNLRADAFHLAHPAVGHGLPVYKEARAEYNKATRELKV